jgi:hypothetical protein
VNATLNIPEATNTYEAPVSPLEAIAEGPMSKEDLQELLRFHGSNLYSK